MGTDDVGLARRHVVGAIRELFEETGVLLAGPDMSTTVEGTSSHEWMRIRVAVADQEKTFTELLAKRGLSLRTDLLKPLVNWRSPDFAHRRFDTRYFAATVPMNQQPTPPGEQGHLGPLGVRHQGHRRTRHHRPGRRGGPGEHRGLTLGQLLVPGSEIMLEKMAAANGCIAYLSYKRKPHVYQAQPGRGRRQADARSRGRQNSSRRPPARALAVPVRLDALNVSLLQDSETQISRLVRWPSHTWVSSEAG